MQTGATSGRGLHTNFLLEEKPLPFGVLTLKLCYSTGHYMSSQAFKLSHRRDGPNECHRRLVLRASERPLAAAPAHVPPPGPIQTNQIYINSAEPKAYYLAWLTSVPRSELSELLWVFIVVVVSSLQFCVCLASSWIHLVNGQP